MTRRIQTSATCWTDAENEVGRERLASFVPAFFRELWLEEEQEEVEYESAEDEDDHEEEEEQKEKKRNAPISSYSNVSKRNDDISSELRLLTAHLVRLDRLKPFFESEAGRF